MENLQNNILIAKFLGYTVQNRDHGRCKIGNGWVYNSELDYHKSWNSLMPVYHKCQVILIETSDIYNEIFHSVVIFSNITFLYEAVIEAIEYINSTQK